MSHLFKVLLAASMLAGIASAHAGEVSNALGINGLTTNGVTPNRLAFNGTKAEALSQLSGISMDRVVLR